MASAAAAKTSTYNVLYPVLHSKKHYAKGSTIQLTDAEAKPLLKVKAIAAAK